MTKKMNYYNKQENWITRTREGGEAIATHKKKVEELSKLSEEEEE